MAETARKTMTVADFLDWDNGTDIRYELVRGEVVAMVSSLMGHGDLVAAITIAIGKRLARPCRPITNAGIVPPMRDDTLYSANIAATCEPHDPSRRFLQEPK
jgi:Uma2 family endonuclease